MPRLRHAARSVSGQDVGSLAVCPTLAFGFSDVGGGEIVVIGIIALLLFGKNLPMQARNLGRAIAEFKRTISEASNEIHREMEAAADGMEKTVEEVAAEVKKDDPLAGVEHAITGEGNPSAAPQTAADTAPPAGSPVTSPAAATPEVPAAAAASAVSSAAALDDLVRNLPPPTTVPPPLV